MKPFYLFTYYKVVFYRGNFNSFINPKNWKYHKIIIFTLLLEIKCYVNMAIKLYKDEHTLLITPYMDRIKPGRV